MMNVEIEHVVNVMVTQFLVRAERREGEAMLISFRLDISDSDHHNASRGFHLLYHIAPRRTYVDVFSAVTSYRNSTDIKKLQWKFEVSHDSCWRDVGSFNEVYFDMANEVNSSRQAEGLERIAPNDMNQFNRFNRCSLESNLFQWVKVKVERDPSCQNGYRKLITLL